MKGIVISLCDYTGVATQPWRDAGYMAIHIDPQRDNNGQYSTSEARQDDVSGVYVQKEHLTDLQVQNDELRAKIDEIQEAYMDFEIKRDADIIEPDSESHSLVMKAIKSLSLVMNKTQAQTLADIRAEAVIEAANAVVRHNECGFCLHCLLIDHANKIKGAE